MYTSLSLTVRKWLSLDEEVFNLYTLYCYLEFTSQFHGRETMELYAMIQIIIVATLQRLL